MLIKNFTGTWKTDLFNSNQISGKIAMKYDDPYPPEILVVTDRIADMFLVQKLKYLYEQNKTYYYDFEATSINILNSDYCRYYVYQKSSGGYVYWQPLSIYANEIDKILPSVKYWGSELEPIEYSFKQFTKQEISQGGKTWYRYFDIDGEYYYEGRSEIYKQITFQTDFNTLKITPDNFSVASEFVRLLQKELVKKELKNIEVMLHLKLIDLGLSRPAWIYAISFGEFLNIAGENVSANNPKKVQNYKITNIEYDYSKWFFDLIPAYEVTENIPAQYPFVIQKDGILKAYITKVIYDPYTGSDSNSGTGTELRSKILTKSTKLFVVNLNNYKKINNNPIYEHSVSIGGRSLTGFIVYGSAPNYYWGVGNYSSDYNVRLYSVSNQVLSGWSYSSYQNRFSIPTRVFTEGSYTKLEYYAQSLASYVLLRNGIAVQPISSQWISGQKAVSLLPSFVSIDDVVGVVWGTNFSTSITSVVYTTTKNITLYAGREDKSNVPSNTKPFDSQPVFNYRFSEDGLYYEMLVSVPTNNPQGNWMWLNLRALYDELEQMRNDFKKANGRETIIEFESKQFYFAGDFVQFPNSSLVYRITDADYEFSSGKFVKGKYKAVNGYSSTYECYYPTQLTYEIQGWLMDERTGEWIKLKNAELFYQ